jgi:glycine/D-amino acid oxidase-like deaminating enzyme
MAELDRQYGSMDLRSGSLLWPALDGSPPALPPLDRDVRCDVAIIGAGVTGALMADRLSRDGHRVLVLDRRAICSGSTPASTGLLQYEIDTQLVDLIAKVGRDHAERAYRASYRSIADFRALVAGLDDDCALAARSALYLAAGPNDVDDLRAEAAARQAIGIEVDLLLPAEPSATAPRSSRRPRWRRTSRRARGSCWVRRRAGVWPPRTSSSPPDTRRPN